MRLVEYVARLQSPDTWTTLPIHRLQNNMRQVLAAIEKNSKGRYRIVSQPSHKGAKDYLITLKIDSSEGTRISMPAVIQDVLRDLVANARKYTPPGGVIRARLHRSDRELTLIVEDSGIGIPPAEITRVAEFGYRATNVRSNRTCGAGFGLTKAYWVCQRLGGRMWIRSSLGLGTRVTLRIPVPALS